MIRRVTPYMAALLIASTFLADSPLPIGLAQTTPLEVVSATWGTSTAPFEAAAGDRAAPLMVTLLNRGDSTISGIQASMRLSSAFTNLTGGDAASSFFGGNVAVGATANLPFILDIAPSASLGLHRLLLDLRYQVVRGTTVTSSALNNVSVSVLLFGRVDPILTVDANPLTPGVTNTRQFTLSNRGTATATNLELMMTLPSGFSGNGSEMRWLFSELPAGGARTLGVDIFAPPSQAGASLSVAASLAYRDAYGTARNQQRSLGVRVATSSEVIVFTASVTPTVLQPGVENDVELTLSNTGTHPASNVDVTLTMPSTLTLTGRDNRWFFPGILAGGLVRLRVTLFVPTSSAGSGVQLQVNLVYKDSLGAARNTQLAVGLRVGAGEATSLEVVGAAWGSGGQLVEVGPGDRAAPFTITTRNRGDTSISGIQATLHLPAGFSNLTGGKWSTSFFGSTVAVGGIATLPFTVGVAPTAPLGRHTFLLDVRYQEVRGSTVNSFLATGLTITVFLLGRVDLVLALDPTPLTPAAMNTRQLTLANRGTAAATGVEITLSLPGSLSSNGTELRWLFAELSAGSNRSLAINVFVPAAQAGTTLPLTAAIAYRDAYATSRSQQRTLSLRVASSSDIIVISGEVKPAVAEAGRDSAVELTLVNAGTHTANDLDISLTVPAPLSLSGQGNRWYVAALPPGQVLKLPISVFAPLTAAGTGVQLQLNVAYKDSIGASRSVQVAIGFRVAPLPDAQITVAADRTTLTAETINPTTFTLRNEGAVRVTLLTATLSLPGGLALAGASNQHFVAQLEPGQSARFEAPLYASPAIAPTAVQLTVSLTYRDPAGQSRSETRQFGFLISPWSSPLSVTLTGSFLTAGASVRPTFVLVNRGDTPITSVIVTLTLPGAAAGLSPLVFPSGQNQWQFPLLPAGGNLTIQPTILAALNALDNQYQATLLLSYRDSTGSTHTESRPLGFTVRGSIVLEVQNVQVLPPAALAGGNLTVSGTLLNKGTTSAFFTSLTVRVGDAAAPRRVNITTVAGASIGTAYLGEIVRNAPFAFSAPVRLPRTLVNGTYPLTLVFAYQDEYGNPTSMQAVIPVRVGGPGAQAGPTERRPTTIRPETGLSVTSPPVLYAILGAIPLIAVVAYWRRRRVAQRRLRQRLQLPPSA